MRHNRGVVEPDVISRGVQHVGRLMSVAREEFTAKLFEETLVEIGTLDNDERMRGLLEASIDENIVAGINFLERGADAVEEVVAPSAALTYARNLAQRDIPLSALLRAYRIGHARFLDVALPLISTLDDVDPVALGAALVRDAAAFHDRLCDQVGAAYEVERDRWVSSRSGLRQQWLTAVLQGNRVDTRQAERHLDYTFDGLHVALTLWPESEVPGLEGPKLLEETVGTIHRGLSARGRPLVVPNDEREVSVWLRLPSFREDVPAVVQRVLSSTGAPVHAALGEPASGIEGFRHSVAQSSRVARIRQSSGHEGPRVTSFNQVESVVLMAGDLPAARRFVRRVLGDLAGPEARHAMLRATLREFYARHGSYAATATALTMHRNTVQYRLQQAAELAPCDLHDPARTAELVAALELCWWLGRAVTA